MYAFLLGHPPSRPHIDDGAQRALRSWVAAAARAPSTSESRRRLNAAAPLLSLVLSSDPGKKSGGPNLCPDLIQRSSSAHRRRPDVAPPNPRGADLGRC